MNYKLTDLLISWLKEKHGHKEFQIKIMRNPISINFETATASVQTSEEIKVDNGFIRVYPVTFTNAPARVSVFRRIDKRTLWVNPEEPDFFKQIEGYLEL